jgi:Tfp pilus assembly protein PilN
VTRQPDFATSPRRTRELPWETLALTTGVLAVALAAGGAWRARGEAQEARARLTEVRREATAASARLQSLEARSRSEAPTLSAFDAPPARILGDVAAALPPDVRLERVSIDYARAGAVELHVVARDAKAWDGLIARLEGVSPLAEVEPGPESRDGEVRSVVRARWVGVGR